MYELSVTRRNLSDDEIKAHWATVAEVNARAAVSAAAGREFAEDLRKISAARTLDRDVIDRPARRVVAAEEAEAASSQMPDPIDFADLVDLNESKPDVVIDGLAYRQEIVNVVGGPKSHKSWTMVDLGLSVAAGVPFFGRFQTSQGRVLYLDSELFRVMFKDRVSKILDARGLTVDDVRGNFHSVSLRGNNVGVDALRPYFERHAGNGYSLILIDPLYQFIEDQPGESAENMSGGMKHVYKLLGEFAEITGAGIVISHHATKGNQADKDIADVGSGSNVQARACDSHLVIRPHQEERHYSFHGLLRHWAPIDPFVMRWEYPIWEQTEGFDPEAMRRPKKNGGGSASGSGMVPSAETAKLLEFVTEKPRTKEAFAQDAKHAMKIGDKKFRELLARAVDQGLIVADVLKDEAGKVLHKGTKFYSRLIG